MKTLKKLDLKTLSSSRVLANKQMKDITGGADTEQCWADSCSGSCTYMGSRGHCSRSYIGNTGGWGSSVDPGLSGGATGIRICGCTPGEY